MKHILPCGASQRHRSCDTYPRISPQIASWYVQNDVLALSGEIGLDERHSEDELVARILSDLEALAP